MVRPEDVRSPMDRRAMNAVVFDGGTGSYSVAIGVWDDEPALVMRWNGTDEKPKGNPVSTGYPTWFVVPPDLHRAIISQLRLPPDRLRHCEEFLGVGRQ